MSKLKPVARQKAPNIPMQMLLLAIIEKHGGFSEVGRKLGESRQLPDYWTRIGFVPVRRIGPVAEALGVTPWALNYPDLASAFGREAPPWKKVLESTGISKPKIDAILSAGKPI